MSHVYVVHHPLPSQAWDTSSFKLPAQPALSPQHLPLSCLASGQESQLCDLRWLAVCSEVTLHGCDKGVGIGDFAPVTLGVRRNSHGGWEPGRCHTLLHPFSLLGPAFLSAEWQRDNMVPELLSRADNGILYEFQRGEWPQKHPPCTDGAFSRKLHVLCPMSQVHLIQTLLLRGGEGRDWKYLEARPPALKS